MSSSLNGVRKVSSFAYPKKAPAFSKLQATSKHRHQALGETGPRSQEMWQGCIYTVYDAPFWIFCSRRSSTFGHRFLHIRQWWYRFLCSTRAMLSHPPNRLPIGLVSNEARSLLRSLHDHQPKPKLNLRQVPVRRKITASFDVSPHFVGRCAPPSVFCRHACLPAGPRPRVASLLNRDRSCRTRHKTGARRTVCQ